MNYGPSSGPRDAEGEKVEIKTLVDITKIYALTAAEICGVHRFGGQCYAKSQR